MAEHVSKVRELGCARLVPPSSVQVMKPCIQSPLPVIFVKEGSTFAAFHTLLSLDGGLLLPAKESISFPGSELGSR